MTYQQILVKYSSGYMVEVGATSYARNLQRDTELSFLNGSIDVTEYAALTSLYANSKSKEQEGT